MHRVVVTDAEENEVVEVRRSVVLPLVDVVGVAATDVGAAARELAVPVPCLEGTTDPWWYDAFGTPDVEDLAGPLEEQVRELLRAST